MRKLAAALLVLATIGCAAGDRERRGIGHVDAAFVQAATKRSGVWRSKVHLDAGGDVTKLSLYHRDRDAIPQPVLALAEQRFPGSTIRSYETELYADDGWVYEVEVVNAEGRNCEVSANEAGELRYVECRLSIDELPPAITTSVGKLVPGGKIEEVESKEWGDRKDVRVEVHQDGVVHYLIFEPEGELIGRELRVPSVLVIPLR